jgi:carboxylesterase
MRGVAQTFADAGFHVELPRLPGHGTTVEDMMTTGWNDWTRGVEAAYQKLASKVERVVVCGLSMGGSLTLWTALQHPEVAGIACINPAAYRQPDEILDMVKGMVDEGTTLMPGIGSDIAEPGVVESAYEGTPLPPLLSLMDGLGQQETRYGELSMPMLLMTSEQDHVVDPDQSRRLAHEYGTSLKHVWLTRSYHVATLDYDRDIIHEEVLAFGRKVCSA